MVCCVFLHYCARTLEKHSDTGYNDRKRRINNPAIIIAQLNIFARDRSRSQPLPLQRSDMHMLYTITSSEQFKKRVTVHLPRAAVILSVEEASYFKFCSPDSSSGPPYEFEEMNGGYLPCLLPIDLQHFSCIVVGTSKGVNQLFLSRMFYKSNFAKMNLQLITKNDAHFCKG